MKNFFYVCELNLSHPKAPEVKDVPEDVRTVTFISRSFMDSEAALASIEEDILRKMAKELKAGNVPVRVSEVNPLLLKTEEQLNEQVTAQPDYAEYLSTWEVDLVGRMTIIDENCEEEGMEEVSYTEMPPRDFILRYYLREYDDGIEIPEADVTLMPMHETMQ